MKVVFMGTPDFSVPILENIIKHHEVVAVITQPDKPKGRGKKLVFSPVKECAIKHNIEKIYQPNKIRDLEFVNILKDIEADIFIVAAYGQILSEDVLNIPRYSCVNVHASLLPKYRGAGPIQWSIINGEDKTGITIMYMEKGLDTGDMIIKEEVSILPEDTFKTLHDKMSILGADLILKAMDLIEKGQVNAIPQDDSISTYAPMIDKKLGHIDYNKTSFEIVNLIRGLNPSPMAYSIYKGEILKICAAKEVTGYSGMVGEIVEVLPKEGIVVKTGDTAILVTELQATGSKKMKTSDYLRGHKIDTKEILC